MSKYVSVFVSQHANGSGRRPPWFTPDDAWVFWGNFRLGAPDGPFQRLIQAECDRRRTSMFIFSPTKDDVRGVYAEPPLFKCEIVDDNRDDSGLCEAT